MDFEIPASSYDRFMGRWSAPLAEQFADLVDLGPGDRVLDVGCGPGALTSVLTARFGADAVSAVDPSASFVAAARERLPGVDIRRAGAAALPFDDGVFAATVAQLVVHFMADPVEELRELARVTRPGRVVAACVWDHATGLGPTAAFWAAARETDPDATDESGLPGTRPGHLAELFRAAGLDEVRELTLTVQLDVTDLDELWLPFTFGVGPVGAYVSRLTPAGLDRLRDRFLARMPTPPFTLDAVAWTAVGRAHPGH